MWIRRWRRSGRWSCGRMGSSRLPRTGRGPRARSSPADITTRGDLGHSDGPQSIFAQCTGRGSPASTHDGVGGIAILCPAVPARRLGEEENAESGGLGRRQQGTGPLRVLCAYPSRPVVLPYYVCCVSALLPCAVYPPRSCPLTALCALLRCNTGRRRIAGEEKVGGQARRGQAVEQAEEGGGAGGEERGGSYAAPC